MSKRIMVIDDDPDILEILNIIFEQEGFEVTLSETGEEAENILEINPDLVLMDIKIAGSGKNGADLCYKIKSSPDTLDFSVVLFSSEDNIDEISKQCRANGYIKKPLDIDYFLVKVREFLAA